MLSKANVGSRPSRSVSGVKGVLVPDVKFSGRGFESNDGLETEAVPRTSDQWKPPEKGRDWDAEKKPMQRIKREKEE